MRISRDQLKHLDKLIPDVPACPFICHKYVALQNSIYPVNNYLTNKIADANLRIHFSSFLPPPSQIIQNLVNEQPRCKGVQILEHYTIEIKLVGV